jgi:hypothetical protein
MTSENKKNLTPAELVDRWGGAIGKATLANWRAQGRGPDFIKVGGRVVYPVAAIEAYERENTKGGRQDAAE